MAFGNRIRRTAVSLSLILVVLRNGLVGAAFTLTNAIGETYEVDEVAAAEHSQQFASLITDLGARSAHVGSVTSDELKLIGRFINEVPPNDVGSAALWVQENLLHDLEAQCRLVSAAEAWQIHLLTTAIASTKRTWMDIVPMRAQLHDSHYWNVVSNVPGIARLHDFAGTDAGMVDRVLKFIDDVFVQTDISLTAAIINDKIWAFPRREHSSSRTARSMKLLAWAVSNGEDLVVELLVSIPGVDVNICDGEGWTLLHDAVSNGRNRRIVQLLLDADGIDTNREYRNGCTAWDYAPFFATNTGVALGEELMRKLAPSNNTDADRAERRRNSVMGRQAAQREQERREQEQHDLADLDPYFDWQ
ncbi:hypothetical protein PBRA_009634 [Plasmodiophora brassicae]|uniref:Uncharacterized protein n=1 Tax=Plasmodiophora brassicae TaxID=37360 RepID=A0A0G4IJI6_PLABS|nr:hypothetical protein PBRA_009634 [Plasmodiophora brassicae]